MIKNYKIGKNIKNIRFGGTKCIDIKKQEI